MLLLRLAVLFFLLVVRRMTHQKPNKQYIESFIYMCVYLYFLRVILLLLLLLLFVFSSNHQFLTFHISPLMCGSRLLHEAEVLNKIVEGVKICYPGFEITRWRAFLHGLADRHCIINKYFCGQFVKKTRFTTFCWPLDFLFLHFLSFVITICFSKLLFFPPWLLKERFFSFWIALGRTF